MERDGIGPATQSNAFDKLKSILLDAHQLGLYDDNPIDGVMPPQYDPTRAVIPSPTQLHGIRSAGDDVFRLVADLMSGCGMRNGEALAVNINNIVADDVYRITEQVNQTTKAYAPLKHRKVGDYRDVPLPARVKHTIQWYADTYGTIDGYLLRSPRDLTKPMLNYWIGNQWQRMKKTGLVEIPEGLVVYGFRHFLRLQLPHPQHPHHRRRGMDGPPQPRHHLQDLPPPHARLDRPRRPGPEPRPRRLNAQDPLLGRGGGIAHIGRARGTPGSR
ncbi:hypothetical protein ACIBRY_04280 [Streptomyces anulatus]